MTGRVEVRTKWRPRLALIVVSVMLAVLALPIAILVWFRRHDLASGMTPLVIAAFAGALVLTLLVAYVLTRTITNPINALIARSDAIARSGKAAIQPIDAYGTREIARLSQSFLDLATRMIDRTDYVRSFAAHVSHELKSPLTSIRGAAELLRDDDAMTPAERRRFLDNILADSARLDTLLHRLRELAQAELPTTSGRTTMAALAREVSGRFPGLRVDASPPDAPVPLQHDAGTVALLHLAENAAQHGASELRLTLDRNASATTLTVADNGSGISPGNRDRVFEPFFSTRRETGGTGMGLDIARAALRSHGSDIALAPSEQGAAFRITMPAG
jgi:two-component system OmpR family sensor kinase